MKRKDTKISPRLTVSQSPDGTLYLLHHASSALPITKEEAHRLLAEITKYTKGTP